MDVITHARAVRRGVVIPEHAHFWQLAHGHLRHVGQQVVRNALRIFADEPALMRADGVEVAQQHHVPLRVPHVQVRQDALQHALRLAIGIRGFVLFGHFGDGHLIRIPVDGGAGGEHDALHAVPPRHIRQHQRAAHVVPVILQRLLHAFAHGFEAGEVDDAVDVMLREHALQRGFVQDGGFDELEAVSFGVFRGQATDLANAVQGLFVGVAEVIQHHHAVVRVQQLHHGVAADEPGAAGDQDGGFRRWLRKRFGLHGRPS